MIYEIINKGKGVITSLLPENLLLISPDSIPTLQDLQSVIDNGGYAQLDNGNNYIFFGDDDAGVEYATVLRDGLGNNSDFSLNKNGFGLRQDSLNNRSYIEGSEANGLRLTNGVGFNNTSVNFLSPSVVTTLSFPAKTVAGDYTIATLDDIQESPFELIDEGNGFGVRLKGRNPADFGNIGQDAFDMTYSNEPSETTGATGTGSVSFGDDNAASGYGAYAFGTYILNSGIYSFGSGMNNKLQGYGTAAFGAGHDIKGLSTFVVGQAANIIDDNILDWNIFPQKVLFAIGNGTIQNNDTNYTALTRSDAFLARMNGSIEAPSLTNEVINSDPTGKVLVTREYFESYNSGGSATGAGSGVRPYQVYTALISQIGTDAPTVDVEYENTLESGVVFTYLGVGNYSMTFTNSGGQLPFVTINSGVNASFVTAAYISDPIAPVVLQVKSITNAFADSGLSKTPIEIRVYN